MPSSFLSAFVASLFPAAMRPRIVHQLTDDVRMPAILSGLVQMVACLGLLLLRYPAFFHAQQDAISAQAQLKAMERGGESALMGLGTIILVAYLLRPLSIVLEYFAFEGLVRAAAAFLHSEPVGTLPLYIFMLGQRRARIEMYERKLGPRVPDTIEVIGTDQSEFELKISSCRPKDWSQTLTISWNDQLYELAKSEAGKPPYRWVYLLRRAPVHKVVRGLLNFDPNAVLVRPEE